MIARATETEDRAFGFARVRQRDPEQAQGLSLSRGEPRVNVRELGQRAPTPGARDSQPLYARERASPRASFEANGRRPKNRDNILRIVF